MAFYSSHPPIQLYAYAPMAIPNQPEFYAVYPGGGQPVVDASTFYYEANPKGMMSQSGQCYIMHCSALFYLYINYYKSHAGFYNFKKAIILLVFFFHCQNQN